LACNYCGAAAPVVLTGARFFLIRPGVLSAGTERAVSNRSPGAIATLLGAIPWTPSELKEVIRRPCVSLLARNTVAGW